MVLLKWIQTCTSSHEKRWALPEPQISLVKALSHSRQPLRPACASHTCASTPRIVRSVPASGGFEEEEQGFFCARIRLKQNSPSGSSDDRRSGGHIHLKSQGGISARAISTGCHICLDGLERRDEGGKAPIEASFLSHGAGLRP
ncbi:hypothetical protein Adt_30167 [Abeliophyllum distichum]|uniref:Uncharacterized protein n=1 Tax=Abeliophyllum distichum TaxID=126358 RepID=A0ABD1RBZ5_9LAMI